MYSFYSIEVFSINEGQLRDIIHIVAKITLVTGRGGGAWAGLSICKMGTFLYPLGSNYAN